MGKKIVSIKDENITSDVPLYEYPSELRGKRNLIPAFTNMEVWDEFGDDFIVEPNKISNHGSGGLNKNIRINLEPNSKYVLRLRSDARSYLYTYNNEGVLINANNKYNRVDYIDTSIGVAYLRLHLNPASSSWGTEFYYANLTLVKGIEPLEEWCLSPEDLNLSYPSYIQNFKPCFSDKYILTEELIEGEKISLSNTILANEFIENKEI